MPVRCIDPTDYLPVPDMKLYEVPNESYVRPLCTDEVFLFHRPDGSYSVCTDANGQRVHIYISEEVEIVKGF